MTTLNDIADALLAGQDEEVSELTKRALAEQITAQEILNRGLLAGMKMVGEQFRCHNLFLPEVLLAARAMNAGMEHLKPFFIQSGMPHLGKVVIGTVQGDLHDIGKNLVRVMLKGAGFEVIDLGKDVAPEKFVEAALREGAAIVGMSALLTTTMPVMKNVVELLRERGGGSVKTLVGGAAVSDDFAREIGADGYGYDAGNAVERARELVGKA